MQISGGDKSADSNIGRIRVWRASVQRFLHDSRDILKHHGVTTRAYHAMLEIWAAPEEKGLSIGEIADLIHLRHNSTVGVVNQLCKKGFAIRKRDRRDQRVVYVQLTTQGRVALAALVDDHLRELNKISDDLRKVI